MSDLYFYLFIYFWDTNGLKKWVISRGYFGHFEISNIFLNNYEKLKKSQEVYGKLAVKTVIFSFKKYYLEEIWHWNMLSLTIVSSWP